ncbi:hypothetical protein FOCC_FOCC016284 [Frankliniella occidentalis]|nr:hypothetical protein FOCC_FOCC016284 [Frankliniella occidentalis]
MPIVPKCRQVRPAKRKRSRSSSPAVSSSSSVTDDDVAIMSDSSAAGPEAFDNLDVSNEIEISGSDSIMDVLCYDADDDETMDVAPSSSDCLPEHIVREVVSPDHSYFSLKLIIAGPSRQLKKLPSSTNKSAKSSCVSPIPLPPEFSEPSVPQDMSLLLQDASIKISMFLYQSWICHVSDGGIHVMLLSKKFEKAVQRRLFFLPDGSVQLSVHCEPLPVEEYLREAPQAVSLAKETVGEFVDRCVDIINKVRNEEMCAGLSDEEYKDVWQGIAGAVIDKNPYQENRYTETLRSSKCPKLISIRKWRCGECEKLRRNVHRRQEAFRKEANKFTPNAALSDSQKSEKLVRQQKTVLATNRRLDRLQKKMQQLLEVEGVQVDKEMSDELTDLCKSADLSEVRSLFLQQQLKASKAKSPSSIRWHPTMIRFALGIYLDSPGVYEKMRESGVLALPSSRLLFDYSHVDPAEEGVYDYVLEDINKKLEGMHDYQKYHSLLCDEMHICQNLVYRKSTGEMIGFVKLEKNQVFADIAAMEKYLATGSQKVQPEMASKMLSFMVKGVASNVKEVVASYPVNKLTSQMLYAKTWEVINRCERSGIRIIAFVSDGFAVNRSFLKKHTPM